MKHSFVTQRLVVGRQPPAGRQQAQAELVKRLLTAASVSSPMQGMWVVRQQLVQPQAVCLRA